MYVFTSGLQKYVAIVLHMCVECYLKQPMDLVLYFGGYFVASNCFVQANFAFV